MSEIPNKALRVLFNDEIRAVWLGAWVARARSSGCNDISSPTRFADVSVDDYIERFEKHFKSEDLS